MSNNFLVSIIVPVYNGEKYIKRCIKSLLEQTYQNIEIIVINDGSNDRTRDLVESFNDGKIVLKSIENSGVSNARNIGLDLSKGKYVTFVDADDYIVSDTIETLVMLAEINNVDIVRYNCFLENSKKEKIKLKEFYDNNTIIDSSDSKELVFNYINQPGNSIRCYTPLLFMKNENIIKFNTKLKYLEDKLFYINNLLNKKKILFTNKPMYIYMYNENSKTKKVVDEFQIVKNFQEIINANEYILKIAEKEQYSIDMVLSSCGMLLLHRFDYYISQMKYKDFKRVYKIIEDDVVYETIIRLNSKYLNPIKKIQFSLFKRKKFFLHFVVTKIKNMIG